MRNLRVLAKREASKEKPIHKFHITYIKRSSKNEPELFGTGIISAISEYNAWIVAYENFEKEYPNENAEYFDIKVVMLNDAEAYTED